MIALRRMHPDDHPSIVEGLSSWWDDDGHGRSTAEGSRHRRDLVPRLWCDHFWPTSLVAELDGDLVGFLVAFHSPGRPGEAYAHFLGVHPDHRRSGVGRRLYARLAEEALTAGVHTVRAITSDDNERSVAFHRSVGFEVDGPDRAYESGQPPRWLFTWRLGRL